MKKDAEAPIGIQPAERAVRRNCSSGCGRRAWTTYMWDRGGWYAHCLSALDSGRVSRAGSRRAPARSTPGRGMNDVELQTQPFTDEQTDTDEHAGRAHCASECDDADDEAGAAETEVGIGGSMTRARGSRHLLSRACSWNPFSTDVHTLSTKPSTNMQPTPVISDAHASRVHAAKSSRSTLSRLAQAQ